MLPLILGIASSFALINTAPEDDADDLADVTIPEEAEEREATYRPLGGIPKKLDYYLDNELVGERRYYENGQLAEEKIYRSGKLHGYWRQYYESGRLFAERPYRDGKPDGTFRFYGEDGELLGESTLKDGTGTLREFRHTNLGALDSEIPYVDGNIHGTYRTWGRYHRSLPDGRQEEMVDGVNVLEYREDKPNGWGTTYDSDGRLFSSAFMQDGKLQGVFRKFDAEGRPVRGWPKYYIQSKEVSREEYLRAAEDDPVLRISLDNDRPAEDPDLTRPDP